jgi:hypothetical protein
MSSSFGPMSARDVPGHLRKVSRWLDDGSMSHTKRSYVSTGVARMVRVRKRPGWCGCAMSTQQRRSSVLGVPCQHSRNVLSALDVPCQHNRDVLSALMCHISKIRDVMSALMCHVSKIRDVMSALLCHASKTETSCQHS